MQVRTNTRNTNRKPLVYSTVLLLDMLSSFVALPLVQRSSPSLVAAGVRSLQRNWSERSYSM